MKKQKKNKTKNKKKIKYNNRSMYKSRNEIKNCDSIKIKLRKRREEGKKSVGIDRGERIKKENLMKMQTQELY